MTERHSFFLKLPQLLKQLPRASPTASLLIVNRLQSIGWHFRQSQVLLPLVRSSQHAGTLTCEKENLEIASKFISQPLSSPIACELYAGSKQASIIAFPAWMTHP